MGGERDEPRPLAEHAPRRGEQIRDGDAQRLREEGEEDHRSPPRRIRSSRRPSGTDAATVRIPTACSTSTICFGTSAFTASPPCDKVANSNAANPIPTG